MHTATPNRENLPPSKDTDAFVTSSIFDSVTAGRNLRNLKGPKKEEVVSTPAYLLDWLGEYHHLDVGLCQELLNNKIHISCIHNAVHIVTGLTYAFKMRPVQALELRIFCEKLNALRVKNLHEKALKWMFADLFSLSANQERPQKVVDVEYSSILPDRIHKFLKNLTFSLRKKMEKSKPSKQKYALARAQTLLFLKKGVYEASDDLIEATLTKHEIALTSLMNLIPPEDKQREIDIKNVKKRISWLIEEVFEDEIKSPTVPFVGSPSAYFREEANSRNGGQLGLIQDLFNYTCSISDRSQLFSMSYSPHTGVLENRYDREEISEMMSNEIVEEILSAKHEVGSYSRPVTVVEPLKVRVVTCGPPMKYYVLQWIQKKVLSRMKQFDLFHLVGKPATDANSLSEFILKHLSNENKDRVISGDYSAATDNLNSELSNHSWTELVRVLGLSFIYGDLGISCLSNHHLLYGEDLCLQTNGQLMGSIISFFILCIVNAAMCIEAMCESGILVESEELDLDEIPLLVNGDDCVFSGNQSCWEVWNRIGKSCGLEVSIGKTYYAENWFQINSQCFYINGSEGDCDHINYVNFGLTTPWVSRGNGLRELDSLGDNLNEFLKSYLPKQLSLSIFIRRFRTMLNKVPEGQSWFLPKGLGGLGLFKDLNNFFFDELNTKSEAEQLKVLSAQQRQLAYYLDSGVNHFSEKCVCDYGCKNCGQYPCMCDDKYNSFDLDSYLYDKKPTNTTSSHQCTLPCRSHASKIIIPKYSSEKVTHSSVENAAKKLSNFRAMSFTDLECDVTLEEDDNDPYAKIPADLRAGFWSPCFEKVKVKIRKEESINDENKEYKKWYRAIRKDALKDFKDFRFKKLGKYRFVRNSVIPTSAQQALLNSSCYPSHLISKVTAKLEMEKIGLHKNNEFLCDPFFLF
jgi:hypothetical protein